MRTKILILTYFFFANIQAQNTDIIKITTSASGKTKELAITRALRSALEQSYGSFLSSKSNLKGEELTQEIVRITKGDIHKYQIISEYYFEGRTNVTVKSEISLNQLNTFKEQIGETSVKFDGALFGVKIKLQEINEKSETKSLETLFVLLKKIFSKSLNINLIDNSEPKLNNINLYDIDFNIKIEYNSNITIFNEHLTSSLQSIAMSEIENKSYSSLGKETYKFLINNKSYYFRNSSSISKITKFMDEMIRQNFFHYELSDDKETIFNPSEIIRSENEYKKYKYNRKYLKESKEAQKLFLNAVKYVNKQDIKFRTLQSQRREFFIPGIYIGGKIYSYEKNYQRDPRGSLYNNSSLLHFITKNPKPFTYQESQIINNDDVKWDAKTEVYDQPVNHRQYRKSKYRSEYFHNKYGELFSIFPIYNINSKKKLVWSVSKSKIDPISVRFVTSINDENQMSLSYEIENQAKLDQKTLKLNSLLLENEIKLALIRIDPVNIEYKLAEVTYDPYRGILISDINVISNDLSNLKLSKKKKREILPLMNPKKSLLQQTNFNSILKYLSYDFKKELNNYMSKYNFPYSKTFYEFKIKLSFTKEKLSQISEFKLKKSIDKWN